MLLDKNIPISYIANKVKYDLVIVGAIGMATYLITKRFQHVIPDLPIPIATFIGTAISVLLSFKLNQSYDRWWEARKIWGAIVNDSRNLILQLQSFLQSEDVLIKRMTYRHIAWLYCLGQTLRGQNPSNNLDRFLSPEELSALESHKNKPLAILQLNTLELADLKREGKVDVFSLVHLNNTFVNFVNQMGMCERIKSTIFPATYRKFLHWIIYLFTITLSISLRDIQSYFELPLLLAISGAFFLLERSATHLQDPFSNLPTDTAVTTIARNIEINLKQLIGDKDVPEALPEEKFYVM